MDKADRKSLIAFGYASSIGIALVIAIFGSLYLGNYLDRWLDTWPIFTVIFFTIGIAAGFRNVYVLAKKFFVDDDHVITCVKSESHRKRPLPKKA